MKKIFSILSIVSVAALALPMSVGATAITVGNDSSSRTLLDGYTNFVIIDTNHPASAAGYLTSFSYYALNTNPFRFILVDSSKVVKWVSDPITPSLAPGVNTFTPATSVNVESGWNLGVYFSLTGTIPYEVAGTSAWYTPNDSGLPTAGQTLSTTNTSDNRTYSFVATGTTELLGTLHAEDFGIVNYDTGLGILKGYTAGFGVTDATFAGVTSVMVKLYHDSTLLQTNTATVKFKTDIVGVQFSSPFDIFGAFDYATDGYWTNVRESQYGQSPAFAPNKVVATVILANGKTVTAENTTPTGDPTTIYPTIPPVNPPSEKDQCKNGGWKTFTNPSFKNQGQCVSHFNGRPDNHGSYVSQSTDKKTAAQSTIGMPPKSQKGKK